MRISARPRSCSKLYPLLHSLLILGGALVAPTTYINFVEAQEFTLEQKIEIVAEEYGIASSTLFNLAYSESTLGEFRVGDGGKSCGVIHIHKDYYPEEWKHCDDDWYVLRFAADLIKKDMGYRFTPCSCIQYAKALGVKIPKGNSAWDLMPNSKPAVGRLVLINGNHVAVITSMTEKGFFIREANWQPCKTGSRFIPWNSKSIRGFYSP